MRKLKNNFFEPNSEAKQESSKTRGKTLEPDIKTESEKTSETK